MTVDETVRLVEAIAKLIGVVAWPALLVFVIVKFRPAIASFLESLGEFSLKGAGIEASAKRKQLEAVASLAAASASDSKEKATPQEAARNAVSAVTSSLTPRALRKAGKARVLWVDDKPGNNINERAALEALGIEFVLALSTQDALEKIRRQPFDAIVSDMGRPPDPRAGYTLLDALRSNGYTTPFVIFSASDAPEHKLEALSRGAIGATSRPSELFRLVMKALGGAG